MAVECSSLIDLMPPSFAEGLDDWSSGDGTPDSPTYAGSGIARIAEDADFGACLELATARPVQRLRYMGELPIRHGGFLEIRVRIKPVRGPVPEARIAAWPGGAGGRGVPGVPVAGPERPLGAPGRIAEFAAVIGPVARDGVDLVWDGRVLYAHVGLDLLGLPGALVRIESVAVTDVSARFDGPALRGLGRTVRR